MLSSGQGWAHPRKQRCPSWRCKTICCGCGGGKAVLDGAACFSMPGNQVATRVHPAPMTASAARAVEKALARPALSVLEVLVHTDDMQEVVAELGCKARQQAAAQQE